MNVVMFNVVAEYLDELRAEVSEGRIARGVIRKTFAHRGLEAGRTQLTLVSTTEIAGDLDAPAHIVRLEYLCGILWGPGFEGDKEVMSRAEVAEGLIEKFAKENHLEVRAGQVTAGKP